jgi:DNA-binding transcriptional regulator YiaG
MKLATGQIYGDTAPKRKGRTVKVVRIEKDVAYCMLITEVGGEPADAGQKIEILVEDFDKFELLHDPDAIEEERPKIPKSKVTRIMEAWFAKNPIRLWLKKTKTSHPQLAALVGVSVNSLNNWLTGRMPSDSNVQILAAALGISESEFKSAWDAWLSNKPMP